MGNLARRVVRLEQARTAVEAEEYNTLPRYEWHRRQALRRATQVERDALERLREADDRIGYLRLYERVLRRQSPTLADDVHRYRDLLWWTLDQLEEEWTEEGRNWSTSSQDPEYWKVRQAGLDRARALWLGGELVEDADEARAIVDQILDPDTTWDQARELARDPWGRS